MPLSALPAVAKEADVPDVAGKEASTVSAVCTAASAAGAYLAVMAPGRRDGEEGRWQEGKV